MVVVAITLQHPHAMTTPPRIAKIVGFRFKRMENKTSKEVVAGDNTKCTSTDARWQIMHGYCYNDKRSPPQRGYGYLFTYVRYWDMQQRGGHGLCGGFILKKKPSDGGGTSKKINRWGNCEGEPLRIARFTYNQQNYFDLYAFFDDRPAPVLGFWRKQPGKGAELVAGVDQDGVRHAWGTHINAWARPGHDWTLLGANYVSFSLEVCLAQSTCEEVLAINVEKQENDQGASGTTTTTTTY